jgi:hypothetical protein
VTLQVSLLGFVSSRSAVICFSAMFRLAPGVTQLSVRWIWGEGGSVLWNDAVNC